MARRPRLAAQAAAASMRHRLPNLSDNEDDDSQDIQVTDAPIPQEEEEEDHEQDEDEDDDDTNDAEDDATPSRGSPRPSRSATPRRGRPSTGVGRRKRLGRPPKRAPVVSDEEANEAASDAGTPRRRGGGRGRGGRWGKQKSGLSRNAHIPVDVDGNMLEIVDDEVELPDDLEGETKVDKNGRLQDGREYRVRTFTIIGRDDRLYMLSTEPARCIGFRDSYLFFQKHPKLYKIILDDDEKRDLIERDLMPHSYKGRAIGVVTARSVYREFGAKIVIAGKKVTDDYHTQEAKDRGDIEGELAVPDDRLPGPGEPYNRNQYVAWHGASAVYHTNAPNVPLQPGKGAETKRKRVVVTSDNWMLEHAREASRFNSTLCAAREDNLRGLYDIHTNSMQWPKHMQPTHAHWECISHELPQENSLMKTNLPLLDPVYARNFRIHDLHLESAPESSMGLAETPCALSSVPSYITEELSDECLEAFRKAQKTQSSWQSKWRVESIAGARAQFASSVEWYPK